MCKNFQNYAETTNDSGQRSVARTQARDGKMLSLKNIKINAETSKALKHKVDKKVNILSWLSLKISSDFSVHEAKNNSGQLYF